MRLWSPVSIASIVVVSLAISLISPSVNLRNGNGVDKPHPPKTILEPRIHTVLLTYTKIHARAPLAANTSSPPYPQFNTSTPTISPLATTSSTSSPPQLTNTTTSLPPLYPKQPWSTLPTLPYYSPTTFYTLDISNNPSLQKQTYLISSSQTYKLPTTLRDLGSDIPTQGPLVVTGGLEVGVRGDGVVTDVEAFGEAQSNAAASALSKQLADVSLYQKTFRDGPPGAVKTSDEGRAVVPKARATFMGGAGRMCRPGEGRKGIVVVVVMVLISVVGGW